MSEPWPAKDHAAYETACRLCEQVVVLGSPLALARLMGYMGFGANGYAVEAPLPELRLEVGDRLTPSVVLPDCNIRKLRMITQFPCEACVLEAQPPDSG